MNDFQDEKEAKEFRRWYEEKQAKENQTKSLTLTNSKINPNNIGAITGINTTGINTTAGNLGINTTNLNPNTNPNNPDNPDTGRTMIEKTSIVSIDSRDRDTERFNNINNFKTFLGKIYINVRSIKLISTEFPNTEGVIRKGMNDQVYWINKEDGDLGFPVYNISIRPGSYTSSSLKSELAKRFSLVRRRNGLGEFHYFDVSIDLDTDIVSFRSFEIKNLANNPISTLEGSGIITVSLLNHGLNDGEIVEIIGAKQIAGIPANVLNGSHHINFISTSKFSYQVNVNSISTNDVSGGNNVKLGKQTSFQLLWADYKNVIGPVNLGYTRENSSEKMNSNIINPLTTVVKSITAAEISNGKIVLTSPSHGLNVASELDISNISPSNPSVITTTLPHPFTVGQVVFIKGGGVNNELFRVYGIPTANSFVVNFQFTLGSDRTGKVKFNGEQVSINLLTTTPPLGRVFLAEKCPWDLVDKFIIDFQAIDITLGSVVNAFVGTERVVVNHEAHGFNQITKIQGSGVGLDGNRKAKITTMLPHGLVGVVFSAIMSAGVEINTVKISYSSHNLQTGQSISITQSSPGINGKYFVTVLDSQEFQIYVVGGLPSGGSFTNTCTVKTGDGIVISNSNSTPNVDGGYGRVQYVDDYSFNIFNNDSRNVFPNGITIQGSGGILGVNNSVSLYRAVGEEEGSIDIGGIRLKSINAKHHIEKLIDSNNYLVRATGQYSTKITQGGGGNIRASSEKHGQDYIQTNTIDGEILNKSVSLEGENYVFMIIPELDNSTVSSSSGLKNIFAKLLLNGPPNYILFDNFLSTAKVFEDTPLNRLDELTVQIKNNDGSAYNFNQQDYSFSLEIVEYIDVLKNSGFSSYRGKAER